MIQPIGTATGTLPPGVYTPVQHAQAILRARLAVGGHTPSAAPATMLGRPVLGAAAGDAARAPAERREAMMPDRREPVLTGPRPTFEKTPLEKMRSDIWDVSRPDPNARPQPDDPGGGFAEDGAAVWPELLAHSAYDGLRALDGPPERQTGMDLLT